jgi:CheY-like chemotaxis protein
MGSEENSTVVAIVDDDELIRDALHSLMKAAGFRSLAFASGEEFLNCGELHRQLDNLGQNRRLESIARYLQSTETHRLYIYDLAVTARAAAIQIGWPEK